VILCKGRILEGHWGRGVQVWWHEPCSSRGVRAEGLPTPGLATDRRGGNGVDALEQSDVTAINVWLSLTRLRTALAVAVGVPIISLVGGIDLHWLPVVTIAAVTAALSIFYQRAIARGFNPHRLVYVQLILDTLAIAAGLGALGPHRVLFRQFFLMTIVPATMVSGTCGIVITALSAVCYAFLLSLGGNEVLAQSGPPALFSASVFIFGCVAHHSFFYKQHLRDKNRHLATTSDRLAHANAELSVTAETALGLLEVSRALSTSLDAHVVIDRLHGVAIERLRTDWCATILVDAAAPSGYRLLASRGFGTPADAAIGRGFWDFGALIAAEGLVEVSDATKGPGARALAEWKIGCGLFAAMRCGNRTLGVFASGYRARGETFAPFQRKLVVGIATQAAVAIENAGLLAAQREEAEISAALLQTAELLDANLDGDDRLERLTALACTLIDCDFVNVLLYDDTRKMFRIAAGTDVRRADALEEARQFEFDIRDFPVLTEAARSGFGEGGDGDQPLPMPLEWWQRGGIRSVVAVPLARSGEILGALFAGSHVRSTPYSAKVRRLLTGIAYQTVAAIENGRLVRNLRAANNLKSEFIGTMSHELRTPLNAIMGYSELLRDGDFGAISAEQRDVTVKVLDYSRQLLELIQATLDVSRMESGALPVTVAPVDIAGLLDELERQIPVSWVKPGVALGFDVERDLPEMQSDHAKLKMIVRNLVHNALKFTERGSVTVHATLAPDGATLEIAVTDTGIGITPEDQAIIFEMFRQVDGSDRRRHDGVGLGLYIVRRLTATLGGTIAVESQPGRGSRFLLRFPTVTCLEPGARTALSA
jgi:signal transduction histidine kinase